MKFLSGYKTILVMGFALAVALYQSLIGPLPAIDQETWNIALPIAGLLLRFVTKKPVFTS